jgi:hypothetical protein
MGDGGLAILPYASSSVEVSALTALVAPDSVDPSQLREYLSDIAGRPKATREARNFALAGLAGLHAPVLPRLRAAISDSKLTVRERLMLGLGAAAIGDAATARAVGAALEAEFGEVTGDLARLRVGKSTADITQATALMAMLAAATGDPLAARLWATVEADPGNDLPYGLHAIGFVSRTLERTAPRPASFAYVVGGKREVIDLESGKAFHLSLNQKEFRSLTIETLGGQIGVTTSWAETVKPASYAKDPDITISRRITPSGKIGTAALVRVDLTVHLGPKAPSGCHLVTDLVPSGLVAVGSLESFVAANRDEDQARNVTYPLSQVGQRISFCAEKRPKTGDVRLRYFARVVTAGTYTWEPAVAESRSRAGRAAVTKTGVITIR